ncbi:hypothetical protein HU200_016592 [Digitaria exilis]|uniref:F-box domain-containing protein n=1 Tax=Digitaria exilis TaxID=1010633 RepID=A0A835F735_9POAL|nr:hypothetical protein HU200_016592 [Digitaria exilis]CAB3491330.1 unnamed protein product [Digitaria exilis]
MPGTTRFADLSDEHVAAVLARLPLRDAARARLVCKRWRALATGHVFLLRACASATASRRAAAGFFFNDPFRFRAAYFPFPLGFSDAADEDAPAAAAADLSFLLPNTSPSAASPPGGGGGIGNANVHVTSSCNGLLLVCIPPLPRRTEHYYVCNPLTREVAPIPALDLELLHGFNLAFDPATSPHYKVVAFGAWYDIHVFSSETRSWGRKPIRPWRRRLLGLRSLRAVFWNGSMVWTLGHALIRLVLGSERLTRIPMPPRIKKKRGWICAYIGESGGHLQMIGYTKEEKLTACFEILEMQSDLSKWSVLYQVDLGRVKELYPEIEWPTWDTRQLEHKVIDHLAISPVCVVRGSEEAGRQGLLIFSIPGKIMSYDMEDQRVSLIQEVMSSPGGDRGPYTLEHPWHYFYAYSPSLFTV